MKALVLMILFLATTPSAFAKYDRKTASKSEQYVFCPGKGQYVLLAKTAATAENIAAAKASGKAAF